jgi:hypothetical protein
MSIGFDLEGQKVVQIETAGLLKSLEQTVGRSHHTEIDVLRRPCSVEA